MSLNERDQTVQRSIYICSYNVKCEDFLITWVIHGPPGIGVGDSMFFVPVAYVYLDISHYPGKPISA